MQLGAVLAQVSLVSLGISKSNYEFACESVARIKIKLSTTPKISCYVTFHITQMNRGFPHLGFISQTCSCYNSRVPYIMSDVSMIFCPLP